MKTTGWRIWSITTILDGAEHKLKQCIIQN